MGKRRRLAALLAAAISLVAVAAPASAHHSYAMYDATKTLHAMATIKEFTGERRIHRSPW
jgi:hypothetical protein